MPKLTVRRTGNSLALPIPHETVHDLKLVPGDELMVQLERLPKFLTMAGRLKGRMTPDEFTRLSNKGEELDRPIRRWLRVGGPPRGQ